MDLRQIIFEVIDTIKDNPELLEKFRSLFNDDINPEESADDESMVTLTKENIFACMSDNKGWTKEVINNFGLSFPLPHGWIDRLIGTQIKMRNYRAAMIGRNKIRHR